MSKKGYVILAQNNDVTNYVQQAYLLAMSIKRTQKIKNVSLVTNDTVPDEYILAFDKIIPIPFDDHAVNSTWKVENRWKVYHASPYFETIVFDADMIVLDSLESCWKFAKDRELCFTSRVTNYKGQVINDLTYRKMFIDNDLPNLYSGMFYFKKTELVETFFKLLEYITYNWERFFFEVAPKNSQNFFSIDVAASIATKILGIDDIVVHPNSPFTFIHMKPALQGWMPVPESCYTRVPAMFNSKNEMFIGNYKQRGVFHYVDDQFLTEKMIEDLNG